VEDGVIAMKDIMMMAHKIKIVKNVIIGAKVVLMNLFVKLVEDSKEMIFMEDGVIVTQGTMIMEQITQIAKNVITDVQLVISIPFVLLV
jgi:hypothetical protein